MTEVPTKPARSSASEDPAAQPEAVAPSAQGPVAADQSRKKLPRPSPVALVVSAMLAAGAALAILYAWKLPPFNSAIERTDNAYVRGLVTVTAPQVNGYVAEVYVRDFQTVEQGRALFRIDDRVYRQRLAQAQAQAALAQAQAALATAQADLANSSQTQVSRRAAVAVQIAQIDSAQAEVRRAQAEFARVSDLAQDGSVSLKERDQGEANVATAQASLQQARAQRDAADQDVRAAVVSEGSLQAAVDSARAAVRLAEIDLGNTVVRAPEAGRLGQVGARRGQLVSAGTQLVSLVPPQLWVIANYKERQAGRMAPGQPVTVTVDALDNRRFSGRVDSLSPATGSEFTVLPAQNATGNFTKVSQRMPVRILLNTDQDGYARLRPGLSVVAEVNTADRGGSTR